MLYLFQPPTIYDSNTETRERFSTPPKSKRSTDQPPVSLIHEPSSLNMRQEIHVQCRDTLDIGTMY